MVNPYLIVVAGPTASGKGSLPHKVINHLKFKKQNFTSILIDDLVEKNPYYIKKVASHFKKSKKIKDIIHDFEHPNKTILNKFNDYYFNARKKTNKFIMR